MRYNRKHFRTEEHYWEHFMECDGETWIFNDKAWIEYWAGKRETDEYYIDMINFQNKGFIFFLKYKEPYILGIRNYIYFAYVRDDYRNQGILTIMLKILQKKYKNEDLCLLSVDTTTDKIWEKKGFFCTAIREDKYDCSEYVKLFNDFYF
jgi:GNAT superfamily N-acetyltransferase